MAVDTASGFLRITRSRAGVRGGPCAARSRRGTARAGLTLLELLVVIGIITLLATIAIVVAVNLRKTADDVGCLSNLRRIHAALEAHATENGGYFPDPAASEQPWESLVRPRLKDPAYFRCDADQEIYPTLGSSYDWRDTGDPQTTLAGRSVSDARPDAMLVFEALPGWHGKGYINAITVSGNAARWEEQACLSDLQRSPGR